MASGESDWIASSMRIFHQSRLTLKPSTCFGLYTKPTVAFRDTSGFNSGFAPDRKGTGDCVPCPPGCWNPAGTAAVHADVPLATPETLSQGSLYVSNDWFCVPYRSSIVGARNPCPQVLRTIKSSMGRHSMLVLLRVVAPNVLKF